jgi:hypothetical protein
VLCGVGGYAMQTKAGSLAGQTLPQGIIVLGVFIILVSFLGCVSAYKESRCFLGVVSGTPRGAHTERSQTVSEGSMQGTRTFARMH